MEDTGLMAKSTYEKLLDRARSTGCNIEKLSSKKDNSCCYLIEVKPDYHILCIPDDFINTSDLDDKSTTYFRSLLGVIRVAGGKNLKSLSSLFFNSKAKHIDLSYLECTKLESMLHTFAFCNLQTLNFGNLKTHSVRNMACMFYNCHVVDVDFSALDTSNAVLMDSMFKQCSIQVLDLSSFNTGNVLSMKSMFEGCKSMVIDVSTFDTSSVDNMSFMFNNCAALELDLRSFRVSRSTDLTGMFEGYNEDAEVFAKDHRILEELRRSRMY